MMLYIIERPNVLNGAARKKGIIVFLVHTVLIIARNIRTERDMVAEIRWDNGIT